MYLFSVLCFFMYVKPALPPYAALPAGLKCPDQILRAPFELRRMKYIENEVSPALGAAPRKTLATEVPLVTPRGLHAQQQLPPPVYKKWPIDAPISVMLQALRRTLNGPKTGLEFEVLVSVENGQALPRAIRPPPEGNFSI